MKFPKLAAVVFSIIFLLGGLVAIGMLGFEKSDVSESPGHAGSWQVTDRYSMKDIDSVTSKNNYNFTSLNARNTSVYQ